MMLLMMIQVNLVIQSFKKIDARFNDDVDAAVMMMITQWMKLYMYSCFIFNSFNIFFTEEVAS